MSGVFVYGGCVTRDAAERMKDALPVVGYVARQSLISAASESVPLEQDVHLSSRFQRRCVVEDFASSLFPRLTEEAPKAGLFLMDLMVERFGVLRAPGQRYVTYSAEFRRAGLKKGELGLNGPIPLGDPRHLRLWAKAAGRLKTHLDDLGLGDRTMVVEAEWATSTSDGSPVPTYRGMSSEEANEIYRPYYRQLRRLGFDVVRLPSELSKTWAGHKWSAEPYHYIDEAYDWICRQVAERTGLPTAPRR